MHFLLEEIVSRLNQVEEEAREERVTEEEEFHSQDF